MISLIMPFWNRQEAFNKSLRLLAAAYPDLDMEAVVVSDGSPCEQQVETPWPVRIYRLPEKPAPLSPSVPHNVGVAFARGDVIVLTNPEILHDKPVLPEMLKELAQLGPKGFVMAAAWCPEQNMWHCHSTRAGGLKDGWQATPGACYWFCGMLYRQFFYEAGGLDEVYRLGAGYEDGDFNKRCERAGAKFLIRDDLVVTHPKYGARTPWPAGAFSRNFNLYADRWRPKLNVVCLKWGTLYGPEYVNRLRKMVAANLPAGYPGRFICFTDDPTGLDKDIETRPIPVPQLTGWWGKLSLFKRGVIPDGERVVYFDLDTVIVGDLEPLVSYNGPFALLRDFYRPDGYGSGVMAWEAGKASDIWETYEAASGLAGCWQSVPGGDQAWIEQCHADAVRLQDVFKGQLCSFKVDCVNGPPKDAAVVCFHGEPKPHNCSTDWVRLVWEEGKVLSRSNMVSVHNTSETTVQDNILSACKRDIPWLTRETEHDGVAVFVAGGPSLAERIDLIRDHQADGHLVVTMNGSFQFLQRHGITADWHVVMDARPENVKFVRGVKPKKLLLSSQCHPSLFDAAEVTPTLFHNYTTTALGLVEAKVDDVHFIGGGHTVGLAAMAILYTAGFRKFYLYGYDSSYCEGRHHAYDQRLNNADRVLEAVVDGRTFSAAPWMVEQVNQFQELAPQLANAGCTITVSGEGLLPHVARLMSQPQEITT